MEPSLSDYHRAILPTDCLCLRSTIGASHHPLDRARDRRRSDATWDHRAHFPSACRSAVKKGDLKPHLIRYWLTPPDDPNKDATIKAICKIYHDAPALAEQGERTVSTDELTGVQALERKHPGLPLAPGKIERREFEYVRHGTRSVIVSRDVVTGKILASACGPTRTEDDFLAHAQAVVATDPQVTRWHFVCDTLNIHQSEALVRWVADLEGLEQETLVLAVETLLDSMPKAGRNKVERSGMDRVKSLPEGVNLKAGMPLDIALSLLRPDELEKLRNYVTAYMAKHNSGEA
jgi:hypothetical protein